MLTYRRPLNAHLSLNNYYQPYSWALQIYSKSPIRFGKDLERTTIAYSESGHNKDNTVVTH